jgi:hypothetical protein
MVELISISELENYFNGTLKKSLGYTETFSLKKIFGIHRNFFFEKN